MHLNSYATPSVSMGRMFEERDVVPNIDFEEDRQRILCSSAFKRLASKTQVWPLVENDHINNRLTHSLQVGCVAKTLATRLGLNLELAETIALAHDLGHPPFGHSGESVLNDIMAQYGKRFYHNTHTFKLITMLERKFLYMDGLNLCFETLDGILKHNGPINISTTENQLKTEYVLNYANNYVHKFDFHLDQYSSLEAQAAAIADDISYLNHDLEDSFNHGVVTLDQLKNMPLMGDLINECQKSGVVEMDRIVSDATSKMTSFFIEDVVRNSIKNIDSMGIKSLTDVFKAGSSVIDFSDEFKDIAKQIRAFSVKYLYPDRDIEWRPTITEAIYESFESTMKNPLLLPDYPWRERYSLSTNESDAAVVVCDFVAGMSDNFIMRYRDGLQNGSFL